MKINSAKALSDNSNCELAHIGGLEECVYMYHATHMAVSRDIF